MVITSGSAPPRAPFLVHALEHGRIEIQYRPGVSQYHVDQLQELFNQSDGAYGPGAYLLLVANNSRMPYTVAAVARTVAGVTGQRSSLDPRGRIQLSATVDVDAGRPRVDVELKGRSLQIAGRALGALDVALRGNDDRPLTLSVHAAPPGVPA